ncbi:MAG: hypothetical protein WBZ37_31385 [Mycobacterium sp.]
MKKTIIGGLSAGALVLGAAGQVVGAGIAKADVYGCTDDLQICGNDDDHDGSAFARELWHHAVYLTPGQATELGNRVCFQRAAGVSEREVLDNMETTYSTDLSVDIVLGGERHFCFVYATAFHHPPSAPPPPPPPPPPMKTVEPNAPMPHAETAGHAERGGRQRQSCPAWHVLCDGVSRATVARAQKVGTSRSRRWSP